MHFSHKIITVRLRFVACGVWARITAAAHLAHYSITSPPPNRHGCCHHVPTLPTLPLAAGPLPLLIHVHHPRTTATNCFCLLPAVCALFVSLLPRLHALVVSLLPLVVSTGCHCRLQCLFCVHWPPPPARCQALLCAAACLVMLPLSFVVTAARRYPSVISPASCLCRCTAAVHHSHHCATLLVHVAVGLVVCRVVGVSCGQLCCCPAPGSTRPPHCWSCPLSCDCLSCGGGAAAPRRCPPPCAFVSCPQPGDCIFFVASVPRPCLAGCLLSQTVWVIAPA